MPHLKLLSAGRPWVLAKWAMTVDGKTATYTGSSQWISSPESREIVHTLRGRVDAILVGRGTVRRDNPLLTARPQGVRTAVRVIADSRAALSSDSQLATTAREVPVLVAVCPRPTNPIAAVCERPVARSSCANPNRPAGGSMNCSKNWAGDG